MTTLKYLWVALFLLFFKVGFSQTSYKIIEFDKPRKLDTIPPILTDTFSIDNKLFCIARSKTAKSVYWVRVYKGEFLLTDNNGNVINWSIVNYLFEQNVNGNLVTAMGRGYFITPSLPNLKINEKMTLKEINIVDENGNVRKSGIPEFTIKRFR